MALRAGLPLKDIEFMQFHPTTMYPSGILITEGCRGEGGILRNSGGVLHGALCPDRKDLAIGDVVSRSEQTEIDEGRGINGSVLLDLTHLGAERILTRLPGSRELARSTRASTRSTSRSWVCRARTTTWGASRRTPTASPS